MLFLYLECIKCQDYYCICTKSALIVWIDICTYQVPEVLFVPTVYLLPVELFESLAYQELKDLFAPWVYKNPGVLLVPGVFISIICIKSLHSYLLQECTTYTDCYLYLPECTKYSIWSALSIWGGTIVHEKIPTAKIFVPWDFAVPVVPYRILPYSHIKNVNGGKI